MDFGLDNAMDADSCWDRPEWQRYFIGDRLRKLATVAAGLGIAIRQGPQSVALTSLTVRVVRAKALWR